MNIKQLLWNAELTCPIDLTNDRHWICYWKERRKRHQLLPCLSIAWRSPNLNKDKVARYCWKVNTGKTTDHSSTLYCCFATLATLGKKKKFCLFLFWSVLEVFVRGFDIYFIIHTFSTGEKNNCSMWRSLNDLCLKYPLHFTTSLLKKDPHGLQHMAKIRTKIRTVIPLSHESFTINPPKPVLTLFRIMEDVCGKAHWSKSYNLTLGIWMWSLVR